MSIEVLRDFVEEAKAIATKITGQDLTTDAQAALAVHSEVSDFLERADEAGIIRLQKLRANNSWVGKDVTQGAGDHRYKTRTVIRSKDGHIHLSDPALHFKLAIGHVRLEATRTYNSQFKTSGLKKTI